MKIRKLLLLLFFAIAFFKAEAQNIQGSLRFGSDSKKQRLVIRNNTSAKITGNLTKIKFCLGTNVGDYFGYSNDALNFLSLNTLPTSGNGSFVTKSFASMTTNYINALWTGSIGIDLDPGEEMDIFEFALVVKTPFKLWGQPMSPLSVSFRHPVNTGDGEDWNWIVEVDGVDMTTQDWVKFFSTGPDVTVRTLPRYDAAATLTTFSYLNLPVKLSRLEAGSEGNISRLSWSTTEEINSEYFGIEHSLDAKNWKEVGRLRSFGESREPRDYTFNHTAPTGLNYYRLKMVDLDGTYAYSQIVKVSIEGDARESIYPNPVTSKFELTNGGLNGVSKVRIFDVSGKLVHETAQIDPSGISIGYLASGIFVVELEKAGGALQKHRILKK